MGIFNFGSATGFGPVGPAGNVLCVRIHKLKLFKSGLKNGSIGRSRISELKLDVKRLLGYMPIRPRMFQYSVYAVSADRL